MRVLHQSFLLGAVLLGAGPLTAAETVSLDGVWTLDAFAQPDAGAVRKLPLPGGLAVTRVQTTVPGCAEMTLARAGLLPDPMVSTNAFAFRAYEGHQWLYTKVFPCPVRAPGERYVLVFDGIDTLADIFLNGARIGETDNMLIPHEFDVTDMVRSNADNALQVLIRPVGLASRTRAVGEFGGTMGGGADHDSFRKAPYMYGWDILPHLPVSGLWRSVRLEVRSLDRIEDVAWLVTDLDVKRRTAAVGLKCRVNAPFSRLYSAQVRTRLARNGQILLDRTRPLNGFHVKQVFRGLEDVDFWWPRGAGEPALYVATVELVAADGTVLATDTQRIGIRTVELDYEDRRLPEKPGRFLFRVNGEPIYIRGVDWVPLDPIPSQQVRHLKDVLPMMAELNANLVRVWGGGVYEPDAFFDWCDANGVLVWQDFMNACAVPPQDEGFQRAMRAEALSVVKRLRNHPSLALWAGDNENDLATRWAFGHRLARDPNDNVITRKVFPDVLREYDLTRPYLPSSPYVSRAAWAGEAEASEGHLWNGARAWWKTPYYTDNACWFCSEGGAHGIPARATLERMMPAEDARRPWENPDEPDCRKLRWTPQWLYRATNPYLDMDSHLVHRNDIVLKQAGAMFGDVARNDLDTLVAQSQYAQAESIKFQVELFRSQKFTRKGGFVVWNLRDGWPTVSDAICDYWGGKKKSYFALKAAYRDVLAMVTEDRRLIVVNDTLKPVKGHMMVTDVASGRSLFAGRYVAPANGVAEIATLAFDGQGVLDIVYAAPEWTLRTHYLYGEPPFAWADYARWMKDFQFKEDRE